jgi:uncharacterized protein (DUF2141 family)
MKNLTKTIVFAAIFGLISTITNAQKNYNLTIKVEGLKTREGKIYAALKNDANSFPEGTSVKSATVEVTKDGEIFLKFDNVLEGKYAVLLYQDLNANAQMDFNGQMPAEPFGFSNVTMLMGPPSFEQCAFDLNENKAIVIGLMSF